MEWGVGVDWRALGSAEHQRAKSGRVLTTELWRAGLLSITQGGEELEPLRPAGVEGEQGKLEAADNRR